MFALFAFAFVVNVAYTYMMCIDCFMSELPEVKGGFYEQ